MKQRIQFLIIFARPIAIAMKGPHINITCMLNASYMYHVYYTYIKHLHWLELHSHMIHNKLIPA